MELDRYLYSHADTGRVTLVGPLWEHPEKLEEPVIFVDRGTYFREDGVGISVGDGDSFGAPLDVRLDTDKDFSDLAFALDAIPDGFNEVRLLGFLGGRRDHELFNLGEAHAFLAGRVGPTRLDFDGRILGFSAGRWQFTRTGLFSLAALESATVSLKGDCGYTCPRPVTFGPLRSLGLSNVGHGVMDLECDKPVFILFEDDEA